MGTRHGTAVALDAHVGIPLGHRDSHAPLGVCGGAILPGAVQAVVPLEQGHRQLVAVLAVHGHHDLLDEVRALQLLRRAVLGVRPGGGDLHLRHAGQTHVHSPVVQVHDLLAALFEVGVVVALLHLLHRQVDGDHLGQLEEGRLENRVDPVAQAQVPSQLRGVHDVEVGVLVGQVPLHLGGQPLLQLLRAPGAVQQVCAAVLEVRGGVIFVHIGRCVDAHEVRRGYQIRGVNGLVAEPQVALGQTAGLHGIVGEIRLGVLVCRQADGGDGVLVGAHRAVAAQAPDLAGNLAGMRQLHLLVVQRGVSHVVVDADGEAVLGILQLQIVIHGDELARGGVLGAETVPAAHHTDVAAARLIQGGDHVQIHGLAHGAGLLGPVQHGDLLHRGGDGRCEVLHGEGPVQVDLHHAHLAALGVQVVHGFLHGLAGGAHHHDDLLRVRRAVVVEQLVVPTGELVNLVHVMLDRVRDGGGLDVGALLALEVHVGVHVVAPVGGVLRVQGVAAELLQGLLVYQRT